MDLDWSGTMGKAKAGAGAIASFQALHDRLSKYREEWIFRGHSLASWTLVPKAGRDPYRGHDEALFSDWKRRAAEHLPGRTHTDWEWLAIAQHHGLATRLLDWTTNPLNAAYFAVREKRAGPAVLFAAKFDTRYSKSADLIFDGGPISLDGVMIYRPSGVVPRIVRQGGLFTIHNPPDSSLEEIPAGVVTLDRIVIAEGYRSKLLSELAFYGINSASLFPDLDGLSAFLNWAVESGEFFE